MTFTSDLTDDEQPPRLVADTGPTIELDECHLRRISQPGPPNPPHGGCWVKATPDYTLTGVTRDYQAARDAYLNDWMLTLEYPGGPAENGMITDLHTADHLDDEPAAYRVKAQFLIDSSKPQPPAFRYSDTYVYE